MPGVKENAQYQEEALVGVLEEVLEEALVEVLEEALVEVLEETVMVILDTFEFYYLLIQLN